MTTSGTPGSAVHAAAQLAERLVAAQQRCSARARPIARMQRGRTVCRSPLRAACRGCGCAAAGIERVGDVDLPLAAAPPRVRRGSRAACCRAAARLAPTKGSPVGLPVDPALRRRSSSAALAQPARRRRLARRPAQAAGGHAATASRRTRATRGHRPPRAPRRRGDGRRARRHPAARSARPSGSRPPLRSLPASPAAASRRPEPDAHLAQHRALPLSPAHRPPPARPSPGS